MNRIHIVGRKNSGKTTLIVELVDYLTKQGLRVGTIKHTHHKHELDTPGKDSFRHREAGAHAVGILSPDLNAVFWPQKADGADPNRDNRYDLFLSLMDECDVLLVEGDSSTSATKVEVWRSETNPVPMLEHDSSVEAVITDDEVSTERLKFQRSNLHEFVQWILSKLDIRISARQQKLS